MGPVKARLSVLSQTELALELVNDTATVGKVNLTAGEIDALIAGLAQLRMEMRPAVSRDLPTGIQPKTIIDPLWRVQTLTDSKMVSFRHPGRGWSIFGFSLPEAAKLARALLAALPCEFGGQSPPPSSLH
jgi:hypothetical protein